MKPSRALSLLTTLLLSGASAHALPGDVDSDGAITPRDAVITARIASRTAYPPGVSYADADVAGPAGNYRDNQIDLWDVARILRVAGGLEEMPDAPVSYLGSIWENVTVDADTSKDYALTVVTPTATTSYAVSGHVSGIPQNTTRNTLWFYHFDEGGGGRVARGTDPDANGDYQISLPAQDYSLYYGGTAEESSAAGTLTWDYKTNLNREITVAGPMTVDATAAPPPAAGQLTGLVQTTNIIPTQIRGFSQPSFEDASDPSKSLTLLTGIAGTDAYVVKGVPMTYGLSVIATYQPDPSITFDWGFPTPTELTPGSTVGPTISLPEAVPVSLRFTPPAGSAVATASLRSLNLSGGSLSTQATLAPGANLYQTAFVPSSTRLSISLTLDSPETMQRTLGYTTTVTIPAEGADQTVDLPPLPDMVTFSGHITLPGGLPASNVSMSLSRLPQPNDASPYRMSARVTADANGHFSVPIIPGQYEVQIPAWPF